LEGLPQGINSLVQVTAGRVGRCVTPEQIHQNFAMNGLISMADHVFENGFTLVA
jgi:hypothetical protein